ncbi:MAG: hypothetical protein JWO44_2565 [Bacteroidetes bacterium]|nr:hypothetical protein [Bacteroidota bacterium]
MKIIPDSILIGFLGLGGSEIIMLLLIFLITPLILFLITLQNTFTEISSENRQMPPGQVWLLLIPLFGLIWQFIVVNRLADSLKAEFTKRNIRIEEDRPGSTIGIAYCILNCCSIIPYLGPLAGLAGLICWIIYWTKINGYKKELKQTFNPYIN